MGSTSSSSPLPHLFLQVCIIVVLPGSRFAGPGERAHTATHSFPENAFNPQWKPYNPELKPAFAEIALYWEEHYTPACLSGLLSKLAAQLYRNATPLLCDCYAIAM